MRPPFSGSGQSSLAPRFVTHEMLLFQNSACVSVRVAAIFPSSVSV